jgi:hypothetical protein
VWFDAFVTNVDRTVRNPNLLWWHKSLYLIDHGASLYFHHNWPSAAQITASPFAAIRDHVLLRWATAIEDADSRLRPKLSQDVIAGVLDLVPDNWLAEASARPAYQSWLMQRLEAAPLFVEEAVRARTTLV